MSWDTIPQTAQVILEGTGLLILLHFILLLLERFWDADRVSPEKLLPYTIASHGMATTALTMVGLGGAVDLLALDLYRYNILPLNLTTFAFVVLGQIIATLIILLGAQTAMTGEVVGKAIRYAQTVGAATARAIKKEVGRLEAASALSRASVDLVVDEYCSTRFETDPLGSLYTLDLRSRRAIRGEEKNWKRMGFAFLGLLTVLFVLFGLLRDVIVP